jgi:phosphonopyruvate decarboxylase
MIEPKDFYESITARGVGLYVGVPDSLLANFCAYVDDHAEEGKHLISANEGNAIAIAMGYHMATNKIAMVYMQNSGMGNAVNPLTSLADPEVYKVPMLLVIGWRGEPGIKDEPQHVTQGRLTIELLGVLGLPHWIVDANTDVEAVLSEAFFSMRERNAPVALVIRKDTFSTYKPKKLNSEQPQLAREDALEQLLHMSSKDDLIVSTTGKTSRELFELRAKHAQQQRDFLTVGGMGHTASIALGVVIGQPHRRVLCLDGDGSLLMHMGSMPVIAQRAPKHFIHVLLNNESHESVGGQATAAGVINFQELASAVGYAGYQQAYDSASLSLAWKKLQEILGPVLLEVKIKNGSRKDLGRPTSTPEQNKNAFMGAAIEEK